jgi:hypothetical protein
MTDSGTVVAPAPTEPTPRAPPDARPPRRFVPPPLPAPVAARTTDDTPIELDLDDIEIVGSRPSRRWLTSDWPAPPRGQTVVGPPPFAPARITAAYGVIHL